ncbi:MAG: hypothetical protein IT439_10765 [Phycisphaerales bacterium]|nr:hypothetical protein [Phycisphaerales bacterium]
MTNSAPDVLLVGHCTPDAAMLRMAVLRAVPGARVTSVTDQHSFEAHLPHATYVLVNRVLDGAFDVELGVDLMRARHATWSLVSRYADAQQAARDAGARDGFDKGRLYEARTLEIIRGACTVPRKDPSP